MFLKPNKAKVKQKNALYLTYMNSISPSYIKLKQIKDKLDSIKLSMEIKSLNPKDSSNNGTKVRFEKKKQIIHCQYPQMQIEHNTYLIKSHSSNNCSLNINTQHQYNNSASKFNNKNKINNTNTANNLIEESLSITSTNHLFNSSSSKSMTGKNKHKLLLLSDSNININKHNRIVTKPNHSSSRHHLFLPNHHFLSVSNKKFVFLFKSKQIRFVKGNLIIDNQSKSKTKNISSNSINLQKIILPKKRNLEIGNEDKIVKKSYPKIKTDNDKVKMKKHRFDQFKKELNIERRRFKEMIHEIEEARFANEQKIRYYVMKLKYNPKIVI